jgi:hypothetical protein
MLHIHAEHIFIIIKFNSMQYQAPLLLLFLICLCFVNCTTPSGAGQIPHKEASEQEETRFVFWDMSMSRTDIHADKWLSFLNIRKERKYTPQGAATEANLVFAAEKLRNDSVDFVTLLGLSDSSQVRYLDSIFPYAIALPYPRSSKWLGIGSREPILYSHLLDTAIYGQYFIEFKEYVVAPVHLPSGMKNSRKRYELISHLVVDAYACRKPVIIGGDFNSWIYGDFAYLSRETLALQLLDRDFTSCISNVKRTTKKLLRLDHIYIRHDVQEAYSYKAGVFDYKYPDQYHYPTFLCLTKK